MGGMLGVQAMAGLSRGNFSGMRRSGEEVKCEQKEEMYVGSVDHFWANAR
jgi:hypothetical protein